MEREKKNIYVGDMSTNAKAITAFYALLKFNYF